MRLLPTRKNKLYKRITFSFPFKTLFLIFFIGFTGLHSAFGQYKQIKGYITDPDGNPLVNVAITNKTGYPLGKSNAEGKFVFNYEIPMMGAIPVFNFYLEGYEPTYWEYDKEDPYVHITIHKIIKLVYTEITGVVVDEAGNPLDKVRIISKNHNIKGNYSSTVSSATGTFSFTYPTNTEKPVKIKFYKPGYKSVFWQYDSKNNIRIVLTALPPKSE